MRPIRTVLPLLAAVALVGCFDDDPAAPEQEVALGNVTANVTASTIQAFEGVTASFSSGAQTFIPGASGAFTMTFSNTGTGSPTATVTSGGKTEVFTLSFGSCIFTANGGGDLVAGEVITINPCSFTVATNGQLTGSSNSANITITLGGIQTAPFIAGTVTVNSDGSVTLTTPSGTVLPVGTVNTGAVTGGG